jgi:hypothetical protein
MNNTFGRLIVCAFRVIASREPLRNPVEQMMATRKNEITDLVCIRILEILSQYCKTLVAEITNGFESQ